LLTRRLAVGLAVAAASSRAFGAIAHGPEFREELANRFVDEGTSGAFVAYVANSARLIANDKIRCETAFLPASTFKIPNALIALDTEVVQDDRTRAHAEIS
jgi:beta-lactamase class D